MTREKKGTMHTQLSLEGHALALKGDDLLEALRSNISLIRELTTLYEVPRQPERPEERHVIRCPQDIYELLADEMASLAQEQLRALLLNTKNEVVAQKVIYLGNVNSSIIRPAEVFRPAIIEAAPNIVIAHNHPSGDPTPSFEDIAITRQLMEAGELLCIDLMDHIVIGERRFVSIKESGRL